MCELNQKTVPVREAAGAVLCHDVTEVNPRTGFKGARFRRGHVITDADIDILLDLGKENIYALALGAGQLHEDDAALRLAAAVAGPGTRFVPEPREGKINITAATAGLLSVNVAALERFNLSGQVMCATLHTHTLVAAEARVAGTRAIPLVVDEQDVMEAAEVAAAAGGLVTVTPLRQARAAVIVTGAEVHSGRIEDAFGPVIDTKLAALGSGIISLETCPDDAAVIAAAITAGRGRGADLIIVTGGMSVDPDDVTLAGVRRSGAAIAAYGSAVIPGAMFLTAYFDDGTPVLGVPACGIFHQHTILDLVLPRVLAGERIGRGEIARLGHGGLCLECGECRFPVCPFGKGT